MKRILPWTMALFLLLSPASVVAGDEPEHRVLIYALAIASGCSEREAKLIANSSWSMDMNKSTLAMRGAMDHDVPALAYVVNSMRKDPALAGRMMSDNETLDRYIFRDNGPLARIGPAAFMHALNPKKGDTIVAYKDYMRTQVDSLKNAGAGAEQVRQARLVLMGQYLHMYVDTFVHPDGPVIGHGFEGHPADYAYAHRKEFTEAAVATMTQLRGFLQEDGRKVDDRLQQIGLGSAEKQREFCKTLVDAVADGYSWRHTRLNPKNQYFGEISREEVQASEKKVEKAMNGFFKDLGTSYTVNVPEFEKITYDNRPGGKFRVRSEGSDKVDLEIDNFVHWAQAPQRNGKYDGLTNAVRQKVREEMTWILEQRKEHGAIGAGVEWWYGVKPVPPKATSKLGEPGGIKFENRIAEGLAFQIDLRSVRYDPADGSLILSGPQSDFTVDMNLFIDALRLAVEKRDPFFSLDAVKPVDWDRSLEGVKKEIDEKYFKTPQQKAALVDRLRLLGREPLQHKGRQYYPVPLSELDPELTERLLGSASGLDLREKLVFSPTWLNGSRLGEILFVADVTIKAMVTGLLQHSFGIEPADVWTIEGFEPNWLFEHTGGGGGRVDLELEDSVIRQSGGALDLSQVRPKLRKVHRRLGTLEDLKQEPPCPACARVTDHFAKNWEEYSRRLPVLQELTVVFRSYVAAKLLVRNYPGLVDRILSLPRPPDVERPTRYHRSEPVMWVSVRDGRLDSLKIEGGRELTYFLGMGASGGIDLTTGGRVRAEESSEPSDRWVVDLFSAAAAAGDFREQGDRAAVRLRLFGDHLPRGSQAQAWLFLLAGAGLAWGVLFGLKRSRHQDAASPIVCSHCVGVHRWTEWIGGFCDIASVGTLAFLVWLPFDAARKSSSMGAGQLWVSVAVIGAILAVGLAASLAAGKAVARLGGGRPETHTVLRALGSGSRWAGLVLALILLAGGFSLGAVGERVVRFLGPAVGERLLVALDGPVMLQRAAIVLFAAGLLALLARWVVPPLRRSRPLLLAKPH